MEKSRRVQMDLTIPAVPSETDENFERTERKQEKRFIFSISLSRNKRNKFTDNNCFCVVQEKGEGTFTRANLHIVVAVEKFVSAHPVTDQRFRFLKIRLRVILACGVLLMWCGM